MRTHSWISKGSLSLLAMAAVAAIAQEAPATQEPKKEEPQAEEKPVAEKQHELTISYNSVRDKLGLNHYGRPASGFSIDELRLFSPTGLTTPQAMLTFRGFPNRDSIVEGYIALNSGHTIIRAGRRNYDYIDQSWFPKAPSKDRETDIIVDHSFNPDVGAFVAFHSDEREQNYAAPKEKEKTRTQTYSGGIQGVLLGNDNAGLVATERRTTSDVGLRPTTIQRRYNAHYERQFGDVLSLEGSAGYTRIEQAGQPSSGIRTYSLAGALDLGPNTAIQFNLGRQDLDLNSILNAYIRQRFTSGVRLVHRLSNWSFQAGFKHKESERVRSDQSYVDVPKSNEYEARLAGRLGNVGRLTVRGTWEDLRESAVMTTNDTRQLLWDDRATFQAKLDRGGELFSAYATYTYRFQQNRQRGVEVGWHNVALGGSYVFTPELSGFAEFTADSFRVLGSAETGERLDSYFPNSRSVAAGLSWAKDETLAIGASVNHYNSSNVRGTQLALNVRKSISPDQAFEFVLSPWRHDDRLYNVSGYRATLASLKYTVKF